MVVNVPVAKDQEGDEISYDIDGIQGLPFVKIERQQGNEIPFVMKIVLNEIEASHEGKHLITVKLLDKIKDRLISQENTFMLIISYSSLEDEMQAQEEVLATIENLSDDLAANLSFATEDTSTTGSLG